MTRLTRLIAADRRHHQAQAQQAQQPSSGATFDQRKPERPHTYGGG